MLVHNAKLQDDDQYRQYPLWTLVSQITLNDDAAALHEFHQHRTIFRYRGESALRLAEFLDRLHRNAAETWGEERACEAYDLTLEKFRNIPSPKHDLAAQQDKRKRGVKYLDVDCRYYFKEFLNRIARAVAAEPSASRLEEERRAARVLEKLVTRHFYLSLKESGRADHFRSRYLWRVNGSAIQLWMPRDIAGRERRRWLEDHVDDPDLSRPGERERVQGIIDRHLARGRLEPYRDGDLIGTAGGAQPGSNSELQEIAAQGLGHFLGQEKADSISQQRPAIQKLGQGRLKKLVRRIITDLDRNDYQAAKVAEDFGLSRSALSRFAGLRWNRHGAKDSCPTIPDLYANLAQVLARIPIFREAAKKAGVWTKVKAIRASTTARISEGDRHGQ